MPASLTYTENSSENLARANDDATCSKLHTAVETAHAKKKSDKMMPPRLVPVLTPLPPTTESSTCMLTYHPDPTLFLDDRCVEIAQKLRSGT